MISGSISEDYRIDITYRLISGGNDKHIYLDNEKRDDDTGFLVYSLTIRDELEKSDFFLDGLKEEMPTALYHYIKGFFHKHINHASEADSKLQACLFNDNNYNFEQNRYSDGIHGVRWGVAGVIISCLSLLLAFVLPLFDHSEERIIKELKNNSKQIEMLSDSIKTGSLR